MKTNIEKSLSIIKKSLELVEEYYQSRFDSINITLIENELTIVGLYEEGEFDNRSFVEIEIIQLDMFLSKVLFSNKLEDFLPKIK